MNRKKTSFAFSGTRLSFRILFFVLLSFAAISLNSCMTCKNQIQGDVIGFSDGVYPATFKSKPCIIPFMRAKGEPINLTDTLSFKNAINGLEAGNNTAAYDAMNLGLNRVKNVKKYHSGFRCSQRKYYIIFFTDGKDNISATTEKSYAKYNKKIARKMKTTMGVFNRKNTFESWALLLEGAELKNDNYTEAQKIEMLTPFTGHQNSVRPEVIIDQDINMLFDRFIKKFTTQSFSFYIPKGYSGKRVKMILRDENYTFGKNEKGESVPNDELPENKEHFVSFEGTLVKKWFQLKYRLVDIDLSGNFNFEMEKNKKNGIPMEFTTNLKSNRINFTIRELTKNGELFVPKVSEIHITQQFFDRNAYRTNTEYQPKTVQITDAYVLPIIDCSKSLGNDMQKAKDLMNEAIKEIIPIQEK